MSSKDEAKILIIDESTVEASSLIVLLSSLSRNISTFMDYEQGHDAIRQALDNGRPFDLLFIVFPPPNADEEKNKLAIKAMALALHNGSAEHTIILGGGKMPPKYAKNKSEDHLLSKPITHQRLAEVLHPLGYELPRLNCWEYMHCGREPNGRRVGSQGVCQAALEHAASDMHGGKNGGRVCWAVSGTLCGGCVQGSFACKIKDCMQCDFYHLVQKEEDEVFESIDSILNRLRHKREQLKD